MPSLLVKLLLLGLDPSLFKGLRLSKREKGSFSYSMTGLAGYLLAMRYAPFMPVVSRLFPEKTDQQLDCLNFLPTSITVIRLVSRDGYKPAHEGED